ncbi:MAG: hypothetical protein ACOX0W_04240 [Sphaerochaetaceae bacterium]
MNTHYSKEYIKLAHKRTIHNAHEVSQSLQCRCFFCGNLFDPSEIDYEHTRYEKTTAYCPTCGIDAVLGDASLFPIYDENFALQCSYAWFNGYSELCDKHPIRREFLKEY